MKIFLPSAIVCGLLLAGCGGSGSSSSSTSSAPQANTSSNPAVASVMSSSSAQASSVAPVLTGVFLDAAVANIGYRTNSQQGVTNSKGEFNYRPGERVTFFIGGLELPSAEAASIVTPLDIANTDNLSDGQLINILRLLQSLDADGDATNGIEITPAALAAGTLLDFTVPPEVFAQLPAVQALLQAGGGTRQSLIAIEQAIAHFQATLALINGPASSSASESSTPVVGPSSSAASSEIIVIASSSVASSEDVVSSSSAASSETIVITSSSVASSEEATSSSSVASSEQPASSSSAASSEIIVIASSSVASSEESESSSSQSSSEVDMSSSSMQSSEETEFSSSQSSSEEAESSSSQGSSEEDVSSSSVDSSEAASSSSSSIEPAASIWNLYNGLYHPASNGSVTLADGSLSEFNLSGTGDYFSAGINGTVTLDTSGAGAHTSGVSIANVVNNSGDYPKYFTLIAGVTGNSDGLRVLELEVAMADVGQNGSRLKAILRNDGSNKGVQLESANNGASVNAYGVTDMDKFAIYQIAITLTEPTKGSVQVYRNGNLMPGLSLANVTMRAASAAGDNFLRFGEVSGSAAYKSNVDWLVWTNTGAYTPLQAAESLPADADLGCVYGYGEANDTTTCFAPPASSSSSSSSVIGGESSSSSSFSSAEIRPALMEGFAAYAGVTGGAGGPVITVTTGTELNAALCGIRSSNRSAPVVIMVNGTINHANTTAQGCDTQSDVIEIKNTSNISIIGVGTNALFDEIGIHVRSASNIILQNLHIRNVKKSGSPISNGGDAIGMETNVDRVWIDHNWLEASGGEKAGYDSLLDMKAGVTNVTVSYNLFNDSSRAGLIGSSDSDNKNTNITFHHNWYKNIEQRTPLIRHSLVHIYNNYWSNETIDYMFHGINSRMNAKALVESNYFYNVNNPLIASDDSSVAGCWQTNNENTVLPYIYYSRSVGNGALVIPEVVDGQLQSTCSVTVPYTVAMDHSSAVPAIVMANAGVGKIDTGGIGSSSSSTSSDPIAPSSFSNSSYASSLASWSEASAAPDSSSASSFASSVASWSESSESSSPNSVLINEAFNVDKTTLFSAAYQSISTDPSAALYFITGGGTGITLSNNQLSVAGGRFTIGHRPPRTATTASDISANGDFDLSRPYRISFKVVAASGSGRVQVYVDNNTTSQGNSLHGSNSKVFDALASSLTAGQVIEITPAVGTPTSFIAVRAESSATVVIDDLQVEYTDGQGVSSSSGAVASSQSSGNSSLAWSSASSNSSLTSSSAISSSVSNSSSSEPYIPVDVNLSADCINLATNPNVNWRDTALQTDQEIVECLYQSLGTPVGYGENAKGGYDPDGNSKLTIITKSSSVSVEQQLLEAITGEEHNWIVFDKVEFAQPHEIGMYRLGCSNPTVQSLLNATEAECVNYTQWCANNNVSESACVSTFFNTALNKSNNPIRNPVIGSHKSIDGRMSEAYFLFSGFAIGRDSTGTPTQTAQSVILTHLNFKGAGHTEDHYVDPDMIRSTGASHDIWIHKNTFDTTGDSAFDVKVGAFGITMSFNEILNVKRAALHGSSDSHTIDAQTRTTMHHNLFVTTDDSYMLLGNTLRRVPLIRRGSSHMLNNVFVNYRKDLLSIRVGASVLQQDNMFVVNRIHQEKNSLEASLAELQTNLIRYVTGGNYRGEGNFLWFGDAACNLDETTKTGFTISSGTVANLAENYSPASQGLLGNWRFAAGQELVDYLSATAGKYGQAPFNSPLSGDRHYVLGLGKVACQ